MEEDSYRAAKNILRHVILTIINYMQLIRNNLQIIAKINSPECGSNTVSNGKGDVLHKLFLYELYWPICYVIQVVQQW